MDGWVKIRYDGEQPLVVDHKWWRPGSVRSVSENRLDGLRTEHPGLFSLVGAQEVVQEEPVVLSPEDVRVDNQLESLLPGRVVEALEGAGVISMAALMGMEDEELLAIGGIGAGSLRVIRERLKDL